MLAARLAQPHRHHDVEKRPVNLQHAGTELVDEFDEHFVIAERVQRVNQVGRIECNRQVLALLI